MSLTLGTDTYITLADARAYVTKFGLTPLPADDPTAEALLKRATSSLDRLYGNKYLGIIAEIGQPLAWPRQFASAPHGPGEWPLTDIDSDGNPRDFSGLQPETGWAEVELAVKIQAGVDVFAQTKPTVVAETKKADVLEKSLTYSTSGGNVGYREMPLYNISLILRPLLTVVSAIPMTRGA